MANGIRINRGVKKIEVNDEGDYITLPLGSDTFIRDFYKTLADLQKKVEDEQSKISEADDTENVLDLIDRLIDVDNCFFERTERMFGDGACKKVFGDISPGVEMFLDLYCSLVPYIEEYQKEREARLNKYGAERTGSV